MGFINTATSRTGKVNPKTKEMLNSMKLNDASAENAGNENNKEIANITLIEEYENRRELKQSISSLKH